MLKRTAILLTLSYLLVFIVFHGGHQLLLFFGRTDIAYFLQGSDSADYAAASWLVALAISAVSAGLAVSLVLPLRARTVPPVDVLSAARTAGTALMIASLLSFILLLSKVGNIFVYSREQIFSGVGDTRGFGLILLMLPSALMLLTISCRSRARRFFMIILSGLFFLALLFMGYRTEALIPALVGMTLWKKCGRPIPVALLLTGVLIILVAIPTVRYLRTLGAYNQINQNDISRSVEQAQISDSIVELGGTTGIISDTLRWIPSQYPFQNGSTYLRSLTSSLPNIGMNARESDRGAVAGGASNDTILDLLSPSEWYIYKTNRWKFHMGQGSGFSSVAEAYMNFGAAGVFALFLLTGIALGYWDRIDAVRSRWSVVIIAVVAWPLIKSIRNDFSSFIKPVLFMSIVIISWFFIEKFLLKKRLRKLTAITSLQAKVQ